MRIQMNKIDIYRILLVTVGIGGLATDSVFQTNINHIFGAHASAVIDGLSAVSAIASTTLHTIFNPSANTPAAGAAVQAAPAIAKINTPTPIQYQIQI